MTWDSWFIKGLHAIGAAIVIAALSAVAGVSALATEEGSDDLSSIVRGGHLYDSWFAELGVRPPKESHPAYPPDMTYGKSPADNWRCRECHGWDYKGKDGAYSKGPHYTGIKGIRGMVGADPEKIIAILKDETHQYGDKLSDENLRDLAAFVSRGQVDMDEYIDRATGRAKGDPAKHKEYFLAICANCHGPNGLKLPELPRLGNVAREDPWGSLHTILNGHPGKKMPALRIFNMGIVADILAYIQTLPAVDEIMSSIVRGARLYDNWYKLVRTKPPKQSHPLYPKNAKFADSPRSNWRCKECHGWDYKGKDGAYGKGLHYTGIKGINGMAGAPPERILKVLKDKKHGYSDLLSERDFRDLANFVSKGQFDMDRYIDSRTKRAKGDAARQARFYSVVCAGCHGKNGAKVITMSSLGYASNRDPWRALHRIVNGLPDEAMGGIRVLDLDVAGDTLAYTQTLPTDLVPSSY